MQFLRNAWYMGAWAEEIDRGPVGRTMLGEPVVMFRAEDGRAVAINDADVTPWFPPAGIRAQQLCCA